MVKDYYEILGVTPQASLKEIKLAYRNLAKQFHPDIVGEDVAKLAWFNEIKTAYDILSDENTRNRYHEQRWLLKSEGKIFSKSTLQGPEEILKELIMLEKKFHYSDINRNNKFYVAACLSEILKEKNLTILAQSKDIKLLRSIGDYFFKLLPDLPFNFLDTVWTKLNALPFPESEKKEMEYRFRKWKVKSGRINFFEKYKWIAVVLITALFLILIKLMIKRPGV